MMKKNEKQKHRIRKSNERDRETNTKEKNGETT